MGMTNSGKIEKIQVFHGPNLNLLGTREPEVYGTTTLAEIDGALRAQGLDAGLEVKCFQTNREGEGEGRGARGQGPGPQRVFDLLRGLEQLLHQAVRSPSGRCGCRAVRPRWLGQC